MSSRLNPDSNRLMAQSAEFSPMNSNMYSSQIHETSMISQPNFTDIKRDAQDMRRASQGGLAMNRQNLSRRMHEYQQSRQSNFMRNQMRSTTNKEQQS